MIRNILKIAIRNLGRHKAISIINILGLTLGLTCCMLIFLYTKDEVSFDRFHANGERICRVTATIQHENDIRKVGLSNSPVGPAFKREIPEVTDYLRVQDERFVVKKGNATFYQEATKVDKNFFSFFSFPLVNGDPKTMLNTPDAIVLTEESALKYFGTTDVIGNTLEMEINGTFQLRKVTGVARNTPQNSTIKFEMLMPFNDKSDEWLGFYMNTFVLLRPGADYKTVKAKLDRVFMTYAKNELQTAKDKFLFNDKISFGLQPLLDIHLNTEYEVVNGLKDGSKPIYSYILSGIALLILVIACINFTNLTIAHSLKRGKEVGVRKVMGAERKQLVRQFLGESFLLTFVAFILAIAVTMLVLPIFNDLSNKRLSLTYLADAKLIAGYTLLFIVTGLVAGFYPALVLSGFNPVQALYKKHKFSSKGYLTKSLVVFQFSLAIFLIITTVIVYTQFSFLTNKNLGYNDQNLLVIQLGWNADQNAVRVFKNELEREPSIEYVAAKSAGENTTMAKADEKMIEFGYAHVDEGYFSALQIPVMKGRNFSADFPGDSLHSVIINETFAKEAGWKDPIGKVVDLFWANRKVSVVGVIRDYHFESLKRKIKPQLFVADPGFPFGQVWIKLKDGNIPATLNKIFATYKKLMPALPLEYDFSNAINQKNYAEEANWKRIITFAAFLAIFISAIGLFGLTTLSIEKRVKEIGIRKVLGSSVSGIVTLLSGNFVKLVFISFLIASPLAWYFNRQWLDNFPYRVNMEWWVFAFSGVAAISLALITVGIQAVKAGMMNPVTNLRSE